VFGGPLSGVRIVTGCRRSCSGGSRTRTQTHKGAPSRVRPCGHSRPGPA